MDTKERAAFVSSYTKVLTTAWSSEDFAARLEADPKPLLAEAGLRVPADARVQIVREVGGEPSLESQIALWEQGMSSHVYELHVPDVPQLDTQELSESDLMAVSGGDTYYCCCCCPCCSST